MTAYLIHDTPLGVMF